MFIYVAVTSEAIDSKHVEYSHADARIVSDKVVCCKENVEIDTFYFNYINAYSIVYYIYYYIIVLL